MLNSSRCSIGKKNFPKFFFTACSVCVCSKVVNVWKFEEHTRMSILNCRICFYKSGHSGRDYSEAFSSRCILSEESKADVKILKDLIRWVYFYYNLARIHAITPDYTPVSVTRWGSFFFLIFKPVGVCCNKMLLGMENLLLAKGGGFHGRFQILFLKAQK